jgi:hypothetical protein
MLRNGYRIAAPLALLAIVFAVQDQSAAQSSEASPPRLSMNHVTASVANLNQEADWYDRVLGFHRSEFTRR